MPDCQESLEFQIRPTKRVKWIAGLKAAYDSLGAKQRDRYSWVASCDDGYVFTAEIDHVDWENNAYSHDDGVFRKYVPPLSKENGDAPLSISHAQELLDAVTDSYNRDLKCHLLLVKGTKFGKDIGGIRAAADGDHWHVTEFDGSVYAGFGFTLERVE